jgi:DNA polymerase-3 subunit delta
MVALRGPAIEGFLKRPDRAQPIILLFGPDAGLVRERADALVASAVDDPSDPFALVRMDGDELSSEPSRLVEEALTIPLFGGRRAIRVRAGSRSFASGVETLTGVTIKDCRIVIEAGDLKPDAALRKICEKAKTAAAIPCYLDGARDIARLIEDELRGAGLSIASDARAALVELLGGDRQASRNELRKLALYAHGANEVTLADIDAVISDASDLKIDPILDGAFAGKPALVEVAFTKALAAGTNPGQILMIAQRHAALLHKASLALNDGRSAAQATESGFPRLHFSRKPAVETALQNLSPARLAGAIEQLGNAARDARMQTVLAQDISQRALMAIAANARRRG